MGTGQTWQPLWTDNNRQHLTYRQAPNTPAEATYPPSSPSLSHTTHNSLGETTSLPDFAHAFREPPFAPPTTRVSRSQLATQDTGSIQPYHRDTQLADDSSSQPLHYLGRSHGLRARSHGARDPDRHPSAGSSVFLTSEYRPPPPQLAALPQHTTLHDQLTSSSLENQPRVENERIQLAPLSQCTVCLDVNAIVHDLVFEVLALEKIADNSPNEAVIQSTEAANILRNGLPDAVRWALGSVRTSSSSLKAAAKQEADAAGLSAVNMMSPWRDQGEASQDTGDNEIRRRNEYGDEMRRPHKRPRETGSFDLSNPAPLPVTSDIERQRHQYSVAAPQPTSPQRRIPSPSSSFYTAQSPVPPSHNARMLPSPASLNFPTAPPTIPSISSPASSLHTSAQNAHLQDLQHQVTIKTLAHQTLQREYDSLLQKLERQRTKCATLEKKFEVTDAEINSLTDEKERLQIQVTAFESQIEEIQRAREEDRAQYATNITQYTKILEMSNRLQEQSAIETRHLANEKEELVAKVRALGGSSRTGSPTFQGTGSENISQTLVTGDESASRISDAPDTAGDVRRSSTMRSQSSSQLTAALRLEITQLGERIKLLEGALAAILAAGNTIAEQGQAVREQAENALRGTPVESDPREWGPGMMQSSFMQPS
ncbi:MAG: hypothetical protein M1820_009185 [Bogoriella megaspora]|nr:MAG: hypothetical protein M1820_009185 [Bogoriella megaspora]